MRQKSTKFKLDGKFLYAPTTCTCQTIPVNHPDSGVDEFDDMHVIVNGFRRKVTISYDLITGRELKEMLTLMIKKTSYYNLQYDDPLLGITNSEVYIPNYEMAVLNYAITSEEDGGLYENISFEFIGRKLTDY